MEEGVSVRGRCGMWGVAGSWAGWTSCEGLGPCWGCEADLASMSARTRAVISASCLAFAL